MKRGSFTQLQAQRNELQASIRVWVDSVSFEVGSKKSDADKACRYAESGFHAGYLAALQDFKSKFGGAK